MGAMAAPVWIPTGREHRERISIQATEAFSQAFKVLLDHLTERGRERFLTELQEAAGKAKSDPEAVTRVFESWWRTLVVRHDPDYEEDMARAGTLTEYQTSDELRAALGI